MRQQWVSTTYKLSRKNIYEDKKPITNDVYEDIFEIAQTEYNRFIDHPQAISFTCTLYDRSCTIEKPKWPHKSFTFTYNDGERALENLKIEDGQIGAYFGRYILQKISSKSWRVFHKELNQITLHAESDVQYVIKMLVAYRAARCSPTYLRDLQRYSPGANCGVILHLASKTEYIMILESTPNLYDVEFYSVLFKGWIKAIPAAKLSDAILKKIGPLLRGVNRDNVTKRLRANKLFDEATLMSTVANYLEVVGTMPLYCELGDKSHHLQIDRNGDKCHIAINGPKKLLENLFDIPVSEVPYTVLALYRKHFENSSACETVKMIGEDLAKDTVEAKKRSTRTISLTTKSKKSVNAGTKDKTIYEKKANRTKKKDDDKNNSEVLTALEGRLYNVNPLSYSGLVYLNRIVLAVMEDPDNGLDWYSDFARYFIHRSVYDPALFDVDVAGFGRPRFETISKLSSFEEIVNAIILDDYVYSYAPDSVNDIAHEHFEPERIKTRRNPLSSSKFVDINKNLTRGDKEGIVYAFISDFKRSDYILSTLILIPYCVTVIKTDKAGGDEGSFSYLFYRGFGAKVEEGTATADDLFDKVLEKVLSLNIEDANCGVNLIAQMKHANDIVVDLTGLDESDRFTKIRTELSKFYKENCVICFINGDSHLSVAAHGEEYMISISAPDAADTDMVSKDELLEYILSHIN